MIGVVSVNKTGNVRKTKGLDLSFSCNFSKEVNISNDEINMIQSAMLKYVMDRYDCSTVATTIELKGAEEL